MIAVNIPKNDAFGQAHAKHATVGAMEGCGSSTVLVLAHPDEHSLCASLFRSVARGLPGCRCHDLYRQRFDPVLDTDELRRRTAFDPLVQRATGDLEQCRHLVVVHPDWWGRMPAILAGWIDRLFRPEVAYEMRQTPAGTLSAVGLLTQVALSVVVTRDAGDAGDAGDARVVTADAGGGDGYATCVERVWHEGLAAFCGISDVWVRVITGVHSTTAAERRRIIAEVTQRVVERAAGGRPTQAGEETQRERDFR